MAVIVLDHLTKRFSNGFTAVHDLTLEIGEEQLPDQARLERQWRRAGQD